VTSSPRKGLEPTIELCERLAAAGFTAVPHLSARLVQSRAHLGDLAARLGAAGIREIFAIGGDPAEPAGPYGSAMSMLRALAEDGHSFDRVGIAGYPERHPRIRDRAVLQALLDKQPFASYAVTQICYAPAAIAGWVERVRLAGFRLPILVGMPGVVSRGRLLEISLRGGVGDSVRYLRANAGIVARLVGRTAYEPDAFVAGLGPLVEPGPHAIAGLHLNTFNQVEATERWRRGLLDQLQEGRPQGSEVIR